MPGSATSNRRTPALTREQVAHRALEVLDREGVEGLSMRRLAADLGVGTMTLYGYFRGKAELLDAVVDAASEDFDPPAPRGTWREQVVAYADATRAWLLRHPVVVQRRGEAAIQRPAASRITEGLMRLLLDAGLEPPEAARAFRALFIHVFGSVAFAPREATAQEARELHAALLTLADDEFPALRAVAPHAADALGGAEQFRFGTELLLDAIDARRGR